MIKYICIQDGSFTGKNVITFIFNWNANIEKNYFLNDCDYLSPILSNLYTK